MKGAKELKLSDLWPVMEEQINAGKTVRFAPKGVSMLPMLRQDTDTVLIKSPPKKLKKYDLPLYRRENGQFILHRVVKVNRDGSYTMCGDNQVYRESGITDDNILAIAVGFYRGGEYVSCSDKKYLKYCKKRVARQNAVRIAVGVKRRVKRLIGLH